MLYEVTGLFKGFAIGSYTVFLTDGLNKEGGNGTGTK